MIVTKMYDFFMEKGNRGEGTVPLLSLRGFVEDLKFLFCIRNIKYDIILFRSAGTAFTLKAVPAEQT